MAASRQDSARWDVPSAGFVGRAGIPRRPLGRPSNYNGAIRLYGMLSVMIKLSEIAPAEVELRCEACRRRLGLYSVTWEDDGEYDARGDKLPPVLGGQEYISLFRLEAPRGVPEEDLRLFWAGEKVRFRLEWHCPFCGASRPRRVERLGNLEVVYVKRRPTVWV